MHLQHRFHLQYLNREGSPLGLVPLDINVVPVLECLRLEAERRGWSPGPGHVRDAWIDPLPDGRQGWPRCSGFEAVLDCSPAGQVRTRFPLTYFAEEARRGSARFVAQGKLGSGETFFYHLLAINHPPPARAGQGSMECIPMEEPYPVVEGSLAELERRSMPFGTVPSEQIRVFIPQRVLDQAARQAEAAGAVETGGILIGHLIRDNKEGDLAVRVNALLPARHSQAERTQLTFTPETWISVRDAMTLRGRQEIMLGSAHSHPSKYWCHPHCPPERRRECPLHRDFFSEEDAAMHGSVFPRAYTIALVVTVTDAGIRHALFGWALGRIQQRGFLILDPTGNPPEEAPAPSTHPVPDSSHEKTCS